jgi:GNAT superfamily N-acetyltransferase
LINTAIREAAFEAPAASVIVRAAAASDVTAILDVIAASYGRPADPAWLRYWRWKHEQNPFGVSPCLVAEFNGQLVGVRAFLRWRWRAGTEDVSAVRAVDTATHPEWCGRGIFSRLTARLVEDMRREGVGFIFNTPNRKSMPGYLKMGWTQVTRIPLWVRPLSAFTPLQFIRSGRLPAPVLPLDSVEGVLAAPGLPGFLATLSPGDGRYQTVRTRRYLRWRYEDIPEPTYRARLEIDRGAGALLIARARSRGRLREVTISELLVTPSGRGIRIARALVADLIRQVDADYVAACAARDTAERRVLARSGFLPVPRLGPPLTARRLQVLACDPCRWTNWRCSIGDLELF